MSEEASFNAASRLREHAGRRPGDPALRVPSAKYTTARPAWETASFAELERRSDGYARGLSARGVRAGDRALMLFRPSVDSCAVTFALYKLGAVPVLIDPGMGLRAMRRCIRQAGARVVFGVPLVHLLRLVYREDFAAAEIPVVVGPRLFPGVPVLSDLGRPGGEPFPMASLRGSDPVGLLFTSGSTGPAKGVVATQAMFQAQLDALGRMLDLRPGLVDVQAFAPFAILDICSGVCAVLPRIDLARPAAASPEEIVAAIVDNAPTLAFGSPVIWQNVSRHCLARRIRLPSLRTVLTVGAPIPPSLHRRFREILSADAEVFTPYGATEALPVANIGSAEVLEQTWSLTRQGAGTCVGRPVAGIDLRIISITDEPIDAWRDDLAVPPGELGEIVVGGGQVSAAYHQADAANRLAKIRDGDRILHRMGDLGYLDGQGRLWFCGRKAERLETEGGVIPPVRVEGIFNEHPDVLRTALVGLGPRGREVPVLCVEMEPGRRFTPETVAGLRHLAEGSCYSGLVRHFLPHPGFPTDARHNSKIRREELRGWAAARMARASRPS
ncbi:MAG TPA: fatty acid CoA ligase family protein [Myxococcaceae bacterium]|nr:fatty acid CoA ligase family protein [Myxococcaceae bacterium]